MTSRSALMALSPLDGRYRKVTEPLLFMSEGGFNQHRLVALTEYLIVLSDDPDIPVPPTTKEEQAIIRSIPDVGEEQLEIISAIEKTGYNGIPAVNHDQQACVIFCRMRLEELGLGHLAGFVHLFGTSEDPTSMATGPMLLKGADVLRKAIVLITDKLDVLCKEYAANPMPGQTHGQPASPTTLGKEMNVFRKRLMRKLKKLDAAIVTAKCNGASGCYNAHEVAAPGVDWLDFSERVIEGVARANDVEGRLAINEVTTQIDDNDSYAELFEIFIGINNILIDLAVDMWLYIKDNWFILKLIEGEVGSSAMPHKINPIDFENAEGNLDFVIAILQFFCRRLTRSRLQRDLSGSTVSRNFGMAFGYCLLGYSNIAKGLDKVSANVPVMLTALASHPEVIAEAYQTLLRLAGFPKAYDTLKDVTRGKRVTLEVMHEFVHSLDVPNELKERMLAITPENYIGIAPQLALL